eukprot:CAMPEP_0194526490 /NCGR_PEP_ID=MMETSP0253-20130528/62331_1 /TAXON_ID=2966 /ORGANISM="Noctiluca scintillans" /LENGTH=269 /DNA_ID=CAMNT_0039371321 /DNA_START=34 /DNA_END=840 /DNA_ORIENTATION=+
MSYVASSDDSKQPVVQKSMDGRRDTQKIQDLVKKIQENSVEIKKQANLPSAPNWDRKQQAQDALRAGQAHVQEARRLLEAFVSEEAGQSETHRRLMYQKLGENLTRACRHFDDNWRSYQAAEAERAKREVAVTSHGLELRSMDAEVAHHELSSPVVAPCRKQVIDDVSFADVEMQAEDIQMYAQAIARVSTEVTDMHQTMVDLAEQARSSGEALASIESNMSLADDRTSASTRLIVKANKQQNSGNRRAFCVLSLIALLCIVTIIVLMW